MRNIRGASLIEILLGLLIVTIACLATLRYFAYAKGNIGIQGNRRAALERARERLEQLMAGSVTPMTPPQDGVAYPVTCAGTACTWSAAVVAETVSVDDLPSQPIRSTVQWVDDPSAGTGTGTLDTLALGVKVWFTANTAVDDDFNRVFIRTLRTP